MSDGTINKPERSTHPSSPASGRVKKYIYNDGAGTIEPYFMLSDGVPRTIPGVDGADGAAGVSDIDEITAEHFHPFSIDPSDGVTTISGMSISPLAGRHKVNFNAQFSAVATAVTEQAKTDLAALIVILEALTVTDSTHISAFGNETLLAGVYTLGAAATGTTNTTLILDAENDEDAIFVIRIGTTLTIAADFTMSLINSANPNNVFFLATGALSAAAGSSLQGSFISKSTITTASGVSVLGRLASSTAAISPTAVTITEPPIKSLLNTGSFESFSLFTSAGAVTNAGVSSISADVGTNSGAVTGFTTSTILGNVYTSASNLLHVITSIYVDTTQVSKSARTMIKTFDELGDTIDVYTMIDTTAGQVVTAKIEVDNGSISFGSRIFSTLRLALP
jgi:hypothetical protein